MNSRPEVPSRRVRYLLASIMILAIGLRLYGLIELPLAEDALYTLRDAQSLEPQIVTRPVYYLLQATLLKLLPPTPFVLRLPAFVFGVVGVWVTYWLAQREFGVVAGLAAAFLVAISPWHLYMSQFARYWSLIYLLAATLYLVLLRALETDKPKYYLCALVILVLGALTHPTFAFPIPGICLAITLYPLTVSPRWQPPSRHGWTFLWAPAVILAAIAAGYLLTTALNSHGGSFQNVNGTIRLVPALTQWLSPTVSVAAFFSAIYLLLSPAQPRERQWGAIMLLGCASTLALLLVASVFRPVYAAYATACLPVLYVGVGAGIAKTTQGFSPRSAMAAGAVTLILAAGVAPSTISHLSDGTRFDYRPAYAYIEQANSKHLALGLPVAMQRYYAPELRFEKLAMKTAQLDAVLDQTNGFWVIASYRRYGMLNDPTGAIAHWLEYNCRVVLRTERPRFDYRSYTVRLHWCGAGSPPHALPGRS